MAVTINVNGLSLVHRASGGVSAATLPNVCLTPQAGIPVPYPSVAQSRDLVGGTASIRVDGDAAAATARSVFAPSVGDEPGALGGVVSGTRGAESSFLSFSPTVRLEGSPACRLTDKMLHNRGNTLNAAGLLQKPVKVKATAAKAKAATHVDRLLVEVLDAGNGDAPVHAPVTVMLRAKGVRRHSSTRNKAGQIVFRDVEKRKYRVIAVHSCYPEGYATVDVTKNKQVVQVKVKREQLRDVAKNIRVGANAAGGTLEEGWTAVKANYQDFVIPTFFSSLQGAGEAPLPDWYGLKEKKTRDAIVETLKDAQIEATPLFWAAAAMSSAKSKQWRPNPAWVTKVKRKDALQKVLTFIDKVVARLKEKQEGEAEALFDRVRRVVVINEPMNMITRAVLPQKGSVDHWRFCKNLLPIERDRNYAKSSGKKFYRFKRTAIKNMIKIIEHAHKAMPEVHLIVNDYGVEGYDGKRGVLGMRGYRFYMLIKQLLKGLSKSARAKLVVGFQAHLRSGGQLEGSLAAKEPLDFRPRSIRKQVARFKKLAEQYGIPLKIAVTECDLELPALGSGKTLAQQHKFAEKYIGYKKKKKGNKYVFVKKKGEKVPLPRPANKPFDVAAFYEKRRAQYWRAFLRQRALMRDSIAALLSAGNVESFAMWEVIDASSNFRYHGYHLNRHVYCKHCKDSPDVKVDHYIPAFDVTIPLYRKPCYWGTVAAFKDPKAAGLS